MGTGRASLHTFIGLAIVVTVMSGMALSSTIHYFLMRDQVLADVVSDTDAAIDGLSRSVSDLIASYAVNEYEGIILNLMEKTDFEAILVENFKLGEMLGDGAYVSGKIRSPDWGEIVDYQASDEARIAGCFYRQKAVLTAPAGEVIGTITICGSDHLALIEMRKAAVLNVVNGVAVSVLLIAALFFTVRRVVLRPITDIVGGLARVDTHGLPQSGLSVRGPREIETLAACINDMIASVRGAQAELDAQNAALVASRNQLAEAERKQREVIWGTNVGTWEWNVQTGEAAFNERWAEIVGYTLDELSPVSIETWARLCHPGDLEASRLLLEKHFAGEAEYYDCEARMRHRNGHWIWVQDRGKVVEWTEDGKPLRMSGTHADITQRKEAEAERERVRQDLKRSNEDLEQFSYAVSHDLQAPLRTIGSFLQLLQRRYGNRLGEDADEYIRFAVDAARAMGDMTRDLLEYSRVGTRGQPFEVVDLTDVAYRALENLQAAIVDGGAVVEVSPLPTVVGDRMQLVRLIQNLVGNAIKYHQPDVAPEVTVSSRRAEDCWEVSVTDNGIGIDPEQTGRLFKVFQRLHAQGTYEGTGVGLAICKRIVDRHGGRISVTSDGASRGSTFTFTLPIR